MENETIDEFDFESVKRRRRVYLLESTGFYSKIKDFIELIDRLSLQNFSAPRFIVNRRRFLCPTYGMNTSIYSLKGIIQLCEIGDIVDAFTIVRKIRDNLYLDLFFIGESLNNKPIDFEFSKSFSGMSQEEMLDEVLKYAAAVLEAEDNNENIQNINKWIDNTYSQEDKRRDRNKCFSFYSYKNNIESKYPELKECHDKFLNTIFKELDNGLNNYVHSNGPFFISNDLLDVNKDAFIKSIKDLLHYIDVVKRTFLIDLFFIDSTLFQTDEYMEAVEMGLKPEESSQYHVIYQVVEEFQRINEENSDLYNYLKSHNRFAMECFYN